ncbi:hypothetical protein AURDEDRAFT_154635 [Auricularia subglabra TFB-10046 SS5]|uniref:Ricin B lectin domain-containing protein n=1 Tax=Auricularia subglabra (strain TFB-10046 / SS5) TaxID=717982 RepID=J0CYG6_AURST|nr:hypothetical protein AURDEDRAFT_154635 [Auricularia subglabra TFB-10046 SS5]
MVFPRSFLAVVIASTTVLGALPPAGVPLWIVNRETGQFFDDKLMLSTPGNPMITFPFVNVQNQRWILHAKHGGNDTAGNFTFECVDPDVKVATSGELGVGLTAQECPSVFTIVDTGGDGLSTVYRITYGPYVVAGSPLRGGDVTLQKPIAKDRLQDWRVFVISDI